MADTFSWQHEIFKLCQGGYAVLILNCRRNFLNMIFEIRLIFSYFRKNSSSALKIDHRVSKLLSVEVFDKISKLHPSIKMKWPAVNQNIHVSQKKSNNHSLCICYLKVIQAQLSLSTLLGTLRVCINSSFFGYFDSLERSTF